MTLALLGTLAAALLVAWACQPPRRQSSPPISPALNRDALETAAKVARRFFEERNA